MRRLLAVLISTFFGFTSLASAGLTLDKRIGNNTEDATTITNGPNANQIALIDGYDVIAVPVQGQGSTAPHALFDVRGAGWAAFPSGIAYVGIDKTFVFGDQGNPDVLTVTDGSGHLLASRPIAYAPGSPPVFATEGLTYLNSDTPFPDTIARGVWDGASTYIEIMSRDGRVHQDISIALPPTATPYVTGIAWASGHFLVSTADQNIWTVGTDGSVLAGPVVLPDAVDVEGLAALPDGRVFATDYTAGRLFAYTAGLQRNPGADRDFEIGPGISRSWDAVWDTQSGRWVVQGLDRDHQRTIVAFLSADLSSKASFFHVDESLSGLTELADGSFAACELFAPVIDVFGRDGSVRSSTPAPVIPIDGRPHRCISIAYLPGMDAYAAVLRGRGFVWSHTIFVISRTGALLGSFPTVGGNAGVSHAPDDPGSTILAYEPPNLAAYDAAGNLLSSSLLEIGPLVAPFGFAAGPGGTYAVLDGNDSEIGTFAP